MGLCFSTRKELPAKEPVTTKNSDVAQVGVAGTEDGESGLEVKQEDQDQKKTEKTEKKEEKKAEENAEVNVEKKAEENAEENSEEKAEEKAEGTVAEETQTESETETERFLKACVKQVRAQLAVTIAAAQKPDATEEELVFRSFNLEEFVDDLTDNWTELDKDGNGVLDKEELACMLWASQGRKGLMPEQVPPQIIADVDLILQAARRQDHFTFWDFASMRINEWEEGYPFDFVEPAS